MIDTAPVRAGEELDVAALSAYLGEAVELEQFPGGHSNLTYLVRTRDREYVLRRAPMGPVAPKAHDMAREFGILKAVHPHFPPAPEVYRCCEDPQVIGAIFYLMERRCGVVLRTRVPDDFARLPQMPQRVSGALIDCLAALHAIDVERTGLIALGKPEGFLERQVRGWAERWKRAQTSDCPEVDRLIDWLSRQLPASPAPALIHNDFKLDNMMFDPMDPGRVTAVLDWEMAAIGDPLVDLGLTLCYWCVADRMTFVRGEGWWTREQLIERYAAQTGRDVSGIGYYEVFGIFKLAVILQQIYFRYVRGQTRDERFREFDRDVRMLIDRATQKAAT